MGWGGGVRNLTQNVTVVRVCLHNSVTQDNYLLLISLQNGQSEYFVIL